jgi:hypothetical protein
VLEILVDGNPGSSSLGHWVLQAKIPNKPVGYLRGFSHWRGRKSCPRPQDLHPTTSTQLLKDLLDVFTGAALKYNENPAILRYHARREVHNRSSEEKDKKISMI